MWWPIGSKHNSMSLLKDNNLFGNTTILAGTQQSFKNTKNFFKTPQFFLEHNNLGRNTTVLVGTQQSIAVTCDKEKEFRNKWKIFFCPYKIVLCPFSSQLLYFDLFLFATYLFNNLLNSRKLIPYVV